MNVMAAVNATHSAATNRTTARNDSPARRPARRTAAATLRPTDHGACRARTTFTYEVGPQEADLLHPRRITPHGLLLTVPAPYPPPPPAVLSDHDGERGSS